MRQLGATCDLFPESYVVAIIQWVAIGKLYLSRPTDGQITCITVFVFMGHKILRTFFISLYSNVVVSVCFPDWLLVIRTEGGREGELGDLYAWVPDGLWPNEHTLAALTSISQYWNSSMISHMWGIWSNQTRKQRAERVSQRLRTGDTWMRWPKGTVSVIRVK